ncbi:hypothetical protein PV08_00278 [Exophiala spinifera]|uniref:Uncharacterized protein n=1 Tax=Exophiala spinifera TaxID=91928 RepID=A0A0D2C7Z7_9EURO|nr:uncharacterized protein PV08_00278 [Exophiala spinifera]KIW19704.1 hypothetical protein PV08_00278 [Exophiala spinifera]
MLRMIWIILHLNLVLALALTFQAARSSPSDDDHGHGHGRGLSFDHHHYHDHDHDNTTTNTTNAAHHSPPLTARTGPADPVSQLLAIAPSSNTCANAPFPSECTVTTASLAQIIIGSFASHNVSTAPEQAALLSWMAFESGEWKYNRNHFPAPGRPGQGTRVMMMPNYVAEFARSFKELADGDELGGTTTGSGDPDQVLDLVSADKYSFAAAAWYYDTHCTPEVKEGVQTGGEQGWEEFVTVCVGTTVTEGRRGYWVKACEALNIVVPVPVVVVVE